MNLPLPAFYHFGPNYGPIWRTSPLFGLPPGAEGLYTTEQVQALLNQPAEPNDRTATQEFTVRNTLTTYCGMRLSRDIIDQIVAELAAEMQSGQTSWAFKR